jgi:hypothetical protein
MSVFAEATFTGTNWQILTATTPVIGGPWVQHPVDRGNFYIYGNRALCRTGGTNYISGTPASADYTVQVDVRVFSAIGNSGVVGRVNTGAKTFYGLYIHANNNELVLYKHVGGAVTTLDVFVSAGFFDAGSTYTIELEMIGTAIKGYVDGVERCSATDSAITAAGKAGIRCPSISDTTTGKHLDNFIATDGSAAASPRSYVVGMIGL